jgi:hypothetical protein
MEQTSNHIVDMLTSNKRVREEKKELPEDPILATTHNILFINTVSTHNDFFVDTVSTCTIPFIYID